VRAKGPCIERRTEPVEVTTAQRIPVGRVPAESGCIETTGGKQRLSCSDSVVSTSSTRA